MVIVGWSCQEALQRLDLQCKQSLQTGYRPNTQRNYRSRANIYIRFCQIYGLQPFPTTEWNLIRYARYLANGVTSFDTVKAYLSAVKRFHELSGWQFPTQLYILKVEMMSIKRELVVPVKKAIPVSISLLKEMYGKINLSSAVDVVCYAALLLGFCLFLRRSNLVPETGTQFNPREQLTWGDVWKIGHLTMVDVKWSKNNKYRERELILPLIRDRNKVICPVYWLDVLFARFPTKDPNLSLFCYPRNGKLKSLTTDVLSRKFKEWIKLTGRNDEGYTLHGLRRGG